MSLPRRRAWPRRIRASVRMAVPSAGRVSDLAPTLDVLVRHGIGEVQWLGRASDPPSGPLSWALQQPGFRVVLDVPVNRAERLAVALLLVTEDSARLVHLEGTCGGEVALPGGLEAIDEALSACPEGLVVLPTRDTSLERLHQVLDRLAGSGRRTLARGSLALLVDAEQQRWLLAREKPANEWRLWRARAHPREGFGP